MAWREEVAAAVEAWLKLEGPARQSSWRRIGQAASTKDDGTYAIDARGVDLNPDQIDRLRIAGPTLASVEHGFPVLDLVMEGSSYTVRLAQFADPEEPHLWVLRQPTTFLIEALRDRLDELGEAPLANLIADRRPTGTQSVAPTPPGLFEPQQQAYRACLGTGAWLVWGPPGTGKTMVLKKAIVDLIADGKRVLLLSATNIAVDNALYGVVKEHRHDPGDIVRVGTAQLRHVAEDPSVSLNLIVRKRLRAVEDKRHELELALSTLKRRRQQLRQLEKQVADFDPVAFEFAQLLLSRTGGAAATQRSWQQLVGELEQRDVAITGAGADHRAAVQAHADAEHDRSEWRRAGDLGRRVASLRAAAGDREAEAVLHQSVGERARAALDRLTSRSRLRQWFTSSSIDEARRALGLAETEQTRRDDLAHRASTAASAAQSELDEEVWKIAAAAGHTLHALAQIDEDVARTEARLHEFTAAREALAARVVEAQRVRDRAARAHEVVAQAEKHDHPRLHRELEALRTSFEDDEDERLELEKAYHEVEAEYERLARDAQGEVIDQAKLVATTLSRFRTNLRLFSGQYNVVLVDEAAAATLPEVLLAAGRAKQAVVLFGDFMQLAAVVPSRVKNSSQQEIRTWLQPDVFTHCGITDARSAQLHPGCIMLDTQSRFGPTIMQVANAIAYENLKPGPSISARPVDDVEIVLIDTDGLADLAMPHLMSHRAGWWPVGVLLSRALAELHEDADGGVGVVTPYAPQASATLEALRDVEHGAQPLVEVGTAHRFQGREFPIVVFDTVEASSPPALWMASASRKAHVGSWPHDGLRLFNVALTRTQQRLYVIASGTVVQNAPEDNPFAALWALRGHRSVRRIRATALITPPDAAEADDLLDELGSELKEVLARHVEVTDVDDETTFFETFRGEIEKARHSIWLWAPWLTERRFSDLVDALRAAKERGVSITVFVRDPSDTIQRRTIDLVEQLRREVGRAVPMNVMHQKIAVFDERATMIGSLNILSQGWTREVMVTMRGVHFAEKLLKHEHATVFANVPPCAVCHRTMVEIRRTKDGRWWWRCYDPECRTGGGRNAWKQEITF